MPGKFGASDPFPAYLNHRLEAVKVLEETEKREASARSTEKLDVGDNIFIVCGSKLLKMGQKVRLEGRTEHAWCACVQIKL